ncbi:MAG: M18 family aminopeptidase [Clostridiales bacterium]|nr:M18 family aminopeptidase [Clostridiales bacterium]
MIQTEKFYRFLDNSTSPFFVIKNSSEILDKAGFKCLSFEEDWSLQKGGSYYIKLYDTALFAFRVGKSVSDDIILRMAAAHTDFPSFRVKPNPEMREKGYIRLNTESYGGMVLSSWFDRPLSISGKVSLRSEQLFLPKEVLIDIKKPLMVIPNLAIHLNREVNNGVEINKQKDVLPILGMADDEDIHNYFKNYLAQHLNVSAEDILDYDLFIYNLDKAYPAGVSDEFICAPRLDDLSSVYALIQGIINQVDDKDIHMICLFDNEEIGNRTKQGSASLFTTMLLEKIFQTLGKGRMELYEVLHRSFILSVDVAQAYHPNYPAKFDPTNTAELNKGVAIKIDTAQRYAYDTGAIAILQQLCEEYKIPYQKFVNRSDATAGGTMGPVISTQLPARTVDIGVPLLAMHSAVETMGTKDLDSIIRLMEAFFSAER